MVAQKIVLAGVSNMVRRHETGPRIGAEWSRGVLIFSDASAVARLQHVSPTLSTCKSLRTSLSYSP